MWIYPETDSWLCRPRDFSRNGLSRDVQPVTQLAPHPDARDAFKSAKQTAPELKICSELGIFSDFFGEEITAIEIGGVLKNNSILDISSFEKFNSAARIEA